MFAEMGNCSCAVLNRDIGVILSVIFRQSSSVLNMEVSMRFKVVQFSQLNELTVACTVVQVARQGEGSLCCLI